MNLVITRWGATLARNGERFVIRHADDEQAFAADKIKSIILEPGTKITSDAIMLAIEHKIPIHILDRAGKPIGTFWSYYYGSIATIRAQQAQFVNHPDALKWICHILKTRTTYATALLHRIARHAPKDVFSAVKAKIEQIHHIATRLNEPFTGSLPQQKNTIRGLEGVIRRLYFNALNLCLPEKHRFERREHQHAQHPFNVVLNYLYGILYHRVEMALVQAGLDPFLGVLHVHQHRKPALVFDFIELFRHWAEEVTFRLFSEDLLPPLAFEQDGERLLLNKDGKSIVVPAFMEYLHKVIRWRGRQKSRETHIQDEAFELASMIKRWQPGKLQLPNP